MAERDALHGPTSDSEDEGDVDYVPSGDEAGSEEDASGIDSESEADEAVSQPISKRRHRVAETATVLSPAAATASTPGSAAECPITKAALEAQEKKKSDELWSSFLGKVGEDGTAVNRLRSSASSAALSPASARQAGTAAAASAASAADKSNGKKSESPQTFSFAGEDVVIGKTSSPTPAVSLSQGQTAGSLSAEQRLSGKEASKTADASDAAAAAGPAKRPSGLNSVLDMIGKKPKISVLDKSKHDWDKFKEEQNISDELKTFNRGKGGYIGRQEFLNRVDARQFEMEKSFRSSSSGALPNPKK